MRKNRLMDNITKKLLRRVQQGIPITSQPYKSLGEELGLREHEVITHLSRLQRTGLLKRVDLCIDTQKLGLVSTLVACRVHKKDIYRAKKILDAYGNVSHNYLRKHRLNMWFTLNALSKKKLNNILTKVKNDLMPQEIVSLPTKKVYKLKFELNVA